MNLPPEFVAAMEEFEALLASGQAKSPEGQRVWARVMRSAPHEFLDICSAKLRDLLPRPAGLDTEGRPVYLVADIAAKFGTTEAEVVAFIEAISDTVPPSSGPVVRAH